MTAKFNPAEHMMNLKGKDYLQVMWRLVWFREDHPDFNIDTTLLNITEDSALFTCKIYDAAGHQVSSGHGSESKKDFGDFIEKAETKAIGRALAMLGYGTQFAPELDEGDRIVDSPVSKKKNPELPTDVTERKKLIYSYIKNYPEFSIPELIAWTHKSFMTELDPWDVDADAFYSVIEHVKDIVKMMGGKK